MPEVSRVAEPGTNYVLTTFDQTLSMQTYIIALTISDFNYVGNDDVVPRQRIYAKPESIERGEGDFALQPSIELMAVYEDYLGLPYSFPKIDQFACPSKSVFAAMENWGLATYVESALLFNPEIDRTRDQEFIVTIVSHEFIVSFYYLKNVSLIAG